MTAGNSSGINDGAAAVLVTSEARAAELGLRPMARMVASAVAGVDPATMGLGPIPASRLALERAGLAVEDLDLVELNEAFAAQAIPVMRELGLDPEKTNVNGGAIAIGHPLGASGARLTATLLHEMRRRDARYGLATMCIGVGQGIAAIFERRGLMTEERWISVVASGESSVAPDLAIVSFAVTGSGKELAPTRDDVNRRSSSVLASLRELGVAEGDLNAPDVASTPNTTIARASG